MGAFTITSVDCVRAADLFFNPPFKFNSTVFTLMAANGDQIVIRYSGTGELNPLGLMVLSGSFSFTGGTGKYRDIQGGGTLTGVENIGVVPAKGFVSLTGRITH